MAFLQEVCCGADSTPLLHLGPSWVKSWHSGPWANQCGALHGSLGLRCTVARQKEWWTDAQSPSYNSVWNSGNWHWRILGGLMWVLCLRALSLSRSCFVLSLLLPIWSYCFLSLSVDMKVPCEALPSPSLEHYPQSSIVVTLEDMDLWMKFHQIGTEMIITKSGRWGEQDSCPHRSSPGCCQNLVFYMVAFRLVL